ncbi:hypothetical protein XELAEV_180428921mg, partial [Xenopus laevis]
MWIPTVVVILLSVRGA